MVVTLGAMPAQVPHSRMPLVHASSANPEIAQRFGLARPRYQGITGIVGTLQAALDHLGLPRDLDAGRRARTTRPARRTGRRRPRCCATSSTSPASPPVTACCQERVTEWEQLVDDAVAENPEASGYLPQLEAEYDRQATEQLPSSDDLAAEFERYLRELDDPPS